MIESPIRRKNLHYPKDFIPSNAKPSNNTQRFSFNQDYTIDANIIKKYSESIESDKKAVQKQPTITAYPPNPQKIVMSDLQLSQDAPLGQHLFTKKPDINSQILKKPRFSLNHNQQITQNYQNALQSSTSPGSIRKQLQNKQAPLPHQDPCRIDLIHNNPHPSNKIPDSYIKYRSSSNFQQKTWKSSQKEIQQQFTASRIKKSMNQLPTVNKQHLNQSFNTSNAKEIYDNFRKKQQSTNLNFGKVNTFLMSLKHKESEEVKNVQLPRFQPSIVEKIKEDINLITKSKKKASNADKNSQEQAQNHSQSSNEQKRSRAYFKKTQTKPSKNKPIQRIPQYLVSYRSSLSYLKDLYTQIHRHQGQYKLTVKIPKLFTEELIFKNQEKSDLYEIARTIFSELRIPYENLVIKRYTNCTMIISRNTCLIWHFDGKRYLGGWQTEYLDEGSKHGLGLEWWPKSYVYYGEFINNKKQGLGIYKDKNDAVYVGYWKKGKQYEQNDQSQDQENQGEINSYNNTNQQADPYENQDNYYEYL